MWGKIQIYIYIDTADGKHSYHRSFKRLNVHYFICNLKETDVVWFSRKEGVVFPNPVRRTGI